MDAILDTTLNAKQDVKVDVTPNTKVDAKVKRKYGHKNGCYTTQNWMQKETQH